MKPNSFRSLSMTAMLLFVFILGAVLTVPAYADDSTPPPTETPTVLTPPVESVDPASAAEESVTVPEAASAEILAQAPEGTQLTIVNEDGDVLPLATEEAANALVNGDPLWCPVGVAPSSVNPLCSGAFPGFGNVGQGQLVDWLEVHDPAKAGVIWIEYDYDGWNSEPDSSITLNGLDFANLYKFALTVQGGWNGVNGNPALNVATPYSTFNKAFTITGWTGAITLKNLNFSLFDFAGPSDQALEVETKGVITLDKVNVVNNGTSGAGVYDGALLDNTSGVSTVTIKNSTFNNNEGYGLIVISTSTITLSNVKASDNGGNGAQLVNSSALTAKNVILTSGINEFNGNGNTGLVISSHGAITIKDITANENDADGLNVDNHLAGTAQAVTLSGTNMFSGNNTNGLVVNSRGAITVSNLIANNNRNGWGADLNNTSAIAALAVKVTGNNEFKFNGGGLRIQSQGAITTNNITALTDPILFPGNNDGVRLQNDNNYVANVTMTGANIITGNFNNGLYVTSKGSITLNNVNASGNGFGFGALISNENSSGQMPVTLNGVNSFNDNFSGGLKISSMGVVLLNNLTANNNNSTGVLIDNHFGALPKAVTLNGYGTFNNNKLDGLDITTKGAIALITITAKDNLGFGAYLDNFTYGSLSSPQNITINGTNNFNHNTVGIGLFVSTYGSILTNNLTASNNGGGGASFGGGIATGSKSVTLNGINTFNTNGGSGLSVEGSGAITINKVVAKNNGGTAGIYLKNDFVNATGGVKITGYLYSEGNLGHGLDVYTKGAITIANLNIEAGNLYSGALLSNSAGMGDVTISGTNQVFNASDFGLWIITNGSVALNNMTVSGNGLDGIRIANDASNTPQNVTMTGANFIYDNGFYGLRISVHGSIQLNNLDVYGNGLGGAWLENCGYDNVTTYACAPVWATPKGVTISGTNFFVSNGMDGLWVASKGLININNITANFNGSLGVTNGATLNNQWGIGSTGGVTLTGLNIFEGNENKGLEVYSNGAITINNLSADSNKNDGVLLDNKSVTGVSSVAVTLTGVNTFTNNGTAFTGSGLRIVGGGQITLSNVTATSNESFGVSLDNYAYTGSIVVKSGVKLIGINIFSNNLSNGLDIHSRGVVDLSNISADINVDGVHVNTDGIFTMTCSSLNNNTDNGWDVIAGGLITLKSVFGIGNTNGNVTSSIPVAVRGCPVIAPVVIQIVEDEERAAGGAKVKAGLIYDRK